MILTDYNVEKCLRYLAEITTKLEDEELRQLKPTTMSLLTQLFDQTFQYRHSFKNIQKKT